MMNVHPLPRILQNGDAYGVGMYRDEFQEHMADLAISAEDDNILLTHAANSTVGTGTQGHRQMLAQGDLDPGTVDIEGCTCGEKMACYSDVDGQKADSGVKTGDGIGSYRGVNVQHTETDATADDCNIQFGIINETKMHSFDSDSKSDCNKNDITATDGHYSDLNSKTITIGADSDVNGKTAQTNCGHTDLKSDSVTNLRRKSLNRFYSSQTLLRPSDPAGSGRQDDGDGRDTDQHGVRVSSVAIEKAAHIVAIQPRSHHFLW